MCWDLSWGIRGMGHFPGGPGRSDRPMQRREHHTRQRVLRLRLNELLPQPARLLGCCRGHPATMTAQQVFDVELQAEVGPRRGRAVEPDQDVNITAALHERDKRSSVDESAGSSGLVGSARRLQSRPSLELPNPARLSRTYSSSGPLWWPIASFRSLSEGSGSYITVSDVLIGTVLVSLRSFDYLLASHLLRFPGQSSIGTSPS